MISSNNAIWYAAALAALLAAGSVAACSADSDEREGPGAGGADSGSDSDSDSDTDSDADAEAGEDDKGDGGYDNVGTAGCQEIDILFVIDDSGSMECEQTMLVQAFPGFIEVLEEYNNSQSNQIAYRIGVTSTGRTSQYTMNIPGLPSLPVNEKGMDGELSTTDGLTSPWIDGPGDTAMITQKFSEIATLGTNGPGYEMPLLSMSMALDKTASGEVNEGFLRNKAMFVAVVITDEDDCSREDNNFTVGIEACAAAPLKNNLVELEDFKDQLDGLFGGPAGYVFVAIAGKNSCDGTAYPTSCDSDSDDFLGADKATRLQDFVNNFVGPSAGANSLFADICTTTLPDALAQALETIEVACDSFQPPV